MVNKDAERGIHSKYLEKDTLVILMVLPSGASTSQSRNSKTSICWYKKTSYGSFYASASPRLKNNDLLQPTSRTCWCQRHLSTDVERSKLIITSNTLMLTCWGRRTLLQTILHVFSRAGFIVSSAEANCSEKIWSCILGEHRLNPQHQSDGYFSWKSPVLS